MFVFRWAIGAYGPCSSSCIGTQVRDVYCEQEQSDGRIIKVDDAVCIREAEDSKPLSTRPCGVECPDYSWSIRDYGDCSSQCGPGTQTREVYCIRETSGQGSSVVSNTECLRKGLAVPDTSRSCDPPNNCRYNLTKWSACSTSCDVGIQTRAAACFKLTNLGTRVVFLDECARDATLPTPITERTCYQPCPCDIPSWQVSFYSRCPVTCGGASTAFQTRTVYCSCSFNGRAAEVASDSRCAQLTKPSERRPCGQEACPCINHYWRTGSYGQCSLSCGEIGKRTRKVDCVCFLNGKRQLADPLRCDQESQPVSVIDCYPPKCPCANPRWDAGDYAPCSRECSGIQTRTVQCKCSNTTEILDDSVCHFNVEAEKPHTRRSCNDDCECKNYRYSISDWSYCSVSCGEGTQTRKVACYCARENVYEQVTDTATCESKIGEKFPISKRSCFTPCICRNLTYASSPWSRCQPDDCDGYQYRNTSCYCDDVLSDIRHCDFLYIRRPAEKQKCGNCPFVWVAEPWTEVRGNHIEISGIYNDHMYTMLV